MAQGQLPWEFTEQVVRSSYRASTLTRHPDKFPLPPPPGGSAQEKFDKWEGRKKLQKTNFELLKCHAIALNAFILQRKEPRWMAVQKRCEDAWERAQNHGLALSTEAAKKGA